MTVFEVRLHILKLFAEFCQFGRVGLVDCCAVFEHLLQILQLLLELEEIIFFIVGLIFHHLLVIL